jgi:hypothetical protein
VCVCVCVCMCVCVCVRARARLPLTSQVSALLCVSEREREEGGEEESTD